MQDVHAEHEHVRGRMARRSDTLHPTPYTLHPTPYTLHSTPYTLHPTPYTLQPTPYTLHLTHPTVPTAGGLSLLLTLPLPPQRVHAEQGHVRGRMARQDRHLAMGRRIYIYIYI